MALTDCKLRTVVVAVVLTTACHPIYLSCALWYQACVRQSHGANGSASCKYSFLWQLLCDSAACCRLSIVKPAQASVGDVAKYLAEAAKQIFSPQNTGEQPPWEGSGSAFTGSIAHHQTSSENAARLRAVYSAVRSTREAITGMYAIALVRHLKATSPSLLTSHRPSAWSFCPQLRATWPIAQSKVLLCMVLLAINLSF